MNALNFFTRNNISLGLIEEFDISYQDLDYNAYGKEKKIGSEDSINIKKTSKSSNSSKNKGKKIKNLNKKKDKILQEKKIKSEEHLEAKINKPPSDLNSYRESNSFNIKEGIIENDQSSDDSSQESIIEEFDIRELFSYHEEIADKEINQSISSIHQRIRDEDNYTPRKRLDTEVLQSLYSSKKSIQDYIHSIDKGLQRTQKCIDTIRTHGEAQEDDQEDLNSSQDSSPNFLNLFLTNKSWILMKSMLKGIQESTIKDIDYPNLHKKKHHLGMK